MMKLLCSFMEAQFRMQFGSDYDSTSVSLFSFEESLHFHGFTELHYDLTVMGDSDNYVI